MKKVVLAWSLCFVIMAFLVVFNNKEDNESEVLKENLAVYVNNELQENIPNKGDAIISKIVCDNDVTASWNNDSWSLEITDLSKKTKCNLYFISYTGETVFDFDYTDSEQAFTAPVSGVYKVELWGAQGGNSGGNGAYTSGLINLSKGKIIFIYVGGVGSSNPAGVLKTVSGGYNGGGLTNGQNYGDRVFGTGGGATDLRLENGDWNSFQSLKSRIMVAAGGGGRFSESTRDTEHKNEVVESQGGAGGGLIGIAGSGYYSDYCLGLGATQTSGGKIGSYLPSLFCQSGTNSGYTDPGLVTGGFGFGGHHGSQGNNGTGGGSGYYGGSSSGHVASAGGGSSFISGHDGCDAIKEESTEDNIIHTGQSIHYSNLYFTNTVMIDGDGYKWAIEKGEYTGMPSHNNGSIISGNTGNGYARITLISIN